MVSAVANLFGNFLSQQVNSMHQERFMRMQNAMNRENAQLQNSYNVMNALNAGRYERSSKEGAGLNINSDGGYNPIAGLSMPSTGSPQAPQMSPVDFAQANLADSQADLNRANADAVREKTPKEIDEIGSRILLNRVNARLSGVQADNLPAVYTAQINELCAKMLFEEAQRDTEIDKQANLEKDLEVKDATIANLGAQTGLAESQTETEQVKRKEMRAQIAQLYAYVEWLKSDKSLKDEEKKETIERTGKTMYEKLLGRKNVLYYEKWLEQNISRTHYQNLKDYNDARLTMQQAILAWKNNDWFVWHECMNILKLGSEQLIPLFRILAK